MAKRSKTLASNVLVPQSDDEAAEFIRQIGELNRSVGRIQHDMNDDLSRIKEEAEAHARPLIEKADAMTQGVRTFCDANRARLTLSGKVKFHEFGTGKVEWRLRPPSVRFRPGVKVDDIIAWCEAQPNDGFLGFVRVKKEINKDALLATPNRALNIPGVVVSSPGEDFAVTPFEAQIEGAA